MRRFNAPFSIALLIATLLAACGGGGSDSATTAEPTPEPTPAATSVEIPGYGAFECDVTYTRTSDGKEDTHDSKECFAVRISKVGRVTHVEVWQSSNSFTLTDIDDYLVVWSGWSVTYPTGDGLGIGFGGTSGSEREPNDGELRISAGRHYFDYDLTTVDNHTYIIYRPEESNTFWSDIDVEGGGEITSILIAWVGTNTYAIGIERP